MQVRQIQVKNILNKAKLSNAMFSANPYLGCEHNCLYCYASYMLHFNPHSESWGHFVDIKYWPELTLKQKESLAGQTICIGTVTDPYQPIEAQAGRTRQLLEQLQGLGCSLFIITKSDLIMRDVDLLRTFPYVEIAWSICTLDERFRHDMEPCTIPIAQRFAAMEFFHNQGFKTICLMAPIFPVFTDVCGIINYARNKCDEVMMDPLNLRCQNRNIILNYVRQVFPQFWPLFNQIYNQGDQSYWFNLSAQIEQFVAQQGLVLNGQRPDFSGSFAPNYPHPVHSPNVLCHFGKFQHLDTLHRRPEEAIATKTQSSSEIPQSQHQGLSQEHLPYGQLPNVTQSKSDAARNKSKLTSGHQATLFDLDQING